MSAHDRTTQNWLPERHDRVSLGSTVRRFLRLRAQDVVADTATITTATITTATTTTETVTNLTALLPSQIGVPTPTIAADDTIGFAAGVSGGAYFLNKGSATQVVTLPTPVVGTRLTFICGNAGGEILINAAAATTRIVGKGFDVTAATGIKNTAATNVLGDTCSLIAAVAGASGTWIADVVTGTWAAQ